MLVGVETPKLIVPTEFKVSSFLSHAAAEFKCNSLSVHYFIKHN